MSASGDLPIEIHERMLADGIRNQAYEEAISRTILPGEHVVEIGTGTGILSAYALRAGAAKVRPIEYVQSLSDMAARILSPFGERAEVIRGRSYDVQLNDSPEALVTETIGLIGPEENIVELCYDFRARHPGILKLLPAELAVFAQPVWSEAVEARARASQRVFENAFLRTGSDDIAGQIADATLLDGRILSNDLFDALPAGPESLLARYQLGIDFDSAFERTLELRGERKWNAVHLFFRATLCDGVTLSTHFSSPKTHWQHSYVLRPRSRSDRLRVEYTRGSGKVLASWSGQESRIHAPSRKGH